MELKDIIRATEKLILEQDDWLHDYKTEARLAFEAGYVTGLRKVLRQLQALEEKNAKNQEVKEK